VLEIRIGRGMNCDSLNTELFAGSEYPQSNLSTVGDEDFIEHRESVCFALSLQ
jgi:hypothetical protein